jgi:hypothetical protein
MGGVVPDDLWKQTYASNSNETTSKYYRGNPLAANEHSRTVIVCIASCTHVEERLQTLGISTAFRKLYSIEII